MFPAKVLVGHKEFTVRYEPGLAKLASVTGGCMPDTEEVLLDTKLGPATERESVIHELLHALWNQTLLERSFSNDKQEDVVWALTPGLLLLLRSNPDLVAYLLEA